MAAIKNISLAIRFALELWMLAAFGYCGFHLGAETSVHFIACIALPLAVAIIWGVFLSPKARIKLPLAIRLIMELSLFCAVAYLLYVAGNTSQGLALVLIFIVNRLMLLWLKA